jgi:hypothetical protein
MLSIANVFELENFLISGSPINACINYSKYLYSKSFSEYLDFENRYILTIKSSYFLLIFAKSLVFSSKRLILLKLLSLKDSNAVVSFIKEFPKYQNLLPML